MPRTRIEKLWLGGAAVVALLIAVVGYFFLVSPQRARTQDVQGQVSSAQLQASTLQSRIVSLTAQQKRAASYRAALAQAREALPTVDNLSATPAFLKAFQAVARQSSTSVSNLTVGDPTAVTPAAAATPSTTDSATPSATATPTAGATATVPATSLYSVAVTASVSGSTPHLVSFLTRLQHDQPRAVLISSVSLATATSNETTGGDVTMTITMTTFVRPSATVTASTAGTVGAAATPTTTTP